MEDDDEIQSHRSVRSGSQNSQRSDRRISVTVASAARHQNTLTVALPMPQPRTVAGGGGGGRGGGGGGREDCWSEGATAVLIDAWGERYVELNRGNLKQKHWKEVADVVNSRDDCCSKAPKTDVQCKNRIDTVKKKYKQEKTKITSTGGRSSWIFYDRLDQLIGNTVKNGSSPLATPPLRSVPVGIPVGVRSAPVQSLRLKQQQQQHQQLQLQQQSKRLRSPPAYSDSSESEPEPSRDPPESDSGGRKRPRVPFNACSALRQQKQRSREKNRGDSVGELTKAIMKFAEAYEQTESSKMQKMVELQKQSMKFAKELELQRIQFFMKTQLELSQLKHSRRNGENDNKNHHSSNRNTINNNNPSDDGNN